MTPLTNKHAFLLILALLIIGGLVSGLSQGVKKQQEQRKVKDYDSCVAAGGIIMESYPERCRTNGGQTFTRDIGNELEKTDLIRSEYPRPGDTVTSPLSIHGEARGYWFFEANFPIIITNNEDEVLGVGYATAGGEWMTEDFVPFDAQVHFDTKGAKSGFVILKKDNPSDLPEHDDELRIPVTFN